MNPAPRSETLRIDDPWAEVTIHVVGDGQPVVFCHARPFATWYLPLVEQLTRTGVDLQLVRYEREVGRRRAALPRDYTLADDAAVVEQLLAHLHLDGDGVHLVGHSYGGLLALEVARRARVHVRSLALLEPAATGFVAPHAAGVAIEPLLTVACTEGSEAAMRRFLVGICGETYATRLNATVPDGVETALRHAQQFFDIELPAVAAWAFGADDAQRIRCPVLLMCGTESDPRFAGAVEQLESWISQARRVDVDGATHVLMAEEPARVADALTVHWQGLAG